MKPWETSANRLTNKAGGAMVGIGWEPVGFEGWETQGIPCSSEEQHVGTKYQMFLSNDEVSQPNELKFML